MARQVVYASNPSTQGRLKQEGCKFKDSLDYKKKKLN